MLRAYYFFMPSGCARDDLFLLYRSTIKGITAHL